MQAKIFNGFGARDSVCRQPSLPELRRPAFHHGLTAGFLPVLLAVALASSAMAASPIIEKRPFAPRPPPAADGKLFHELPPAETGLTVPNVYNDPRMWGDRFREFTLGAVETGIAVADFDRDGWPDIFVVSKNGLCALYRQIAPFKFVNIAAAAGVDCADSTAPKIGATVVDINQDGWPDIYVCRYDAPNLLFVNNGDGTFTERAHEYGLDIKDSSVMASFADYDGDVPRIFLVSFGQGYTER